MNKYNDLEHYYNCFIECTEIHLINDEYDVIFQGNLIDSSTNIREYLNLPLKYLEIDKINQDYIGELLSILSKYCNLEKNSLFDVAEITEKRKSYFKTSKNDPEIKTSLIAILLICASGRIFELMLKKKVQRVGDKLDLVEKSIKLGEIYQVLRGYIASSKKSYLLEEKEKYTRFEVSKFVRDFISKYTYEGVKSGLISAKVSKDERVKRYKFDNRRKLARDIFESKEFKKINENPNNGYSFSSYDSLIKPLEQAEIDIYSKMHKKPKVKIPKKKK